MTHDRIRVISELDPADPSFDVTDAAVMDVLARAEEGHFWHRTRNEWIAQRLRALGVGPGASVIELGCGGGCVSAHLAASGYDVVGVEGQRSLVELASRRAPRARFFVHDLRRGIDELPERGFDVAGLFDVIEHVEKPEQVVASACALVRDGGLVVGTVPGMRALWSRIDEQAGHRERYEPWTLRAVLERVTDASLVEIVPFNRAIVPLLWVQRRLVTMRGRSESSSANLAVPPRPVNAMLGTVLRWERRLPRWTQTERVSGSSLWFALRTRSGGAKGRS